MTAVSEDPIREEEVDGIIADYLEEVETAGDNAARSAIRVKILRNHPGHESALKGFFAGEDCLEGPGSPMRLPDFGDYERIEYLGEGGFAVVYKAWQKSLGKEVALKVGREKREEGMSRIKDLYFGAGHQARLQHPNIVPVHEVGLCGGKPYFSMDLVAGGSLEGRLNEFGGAPLEAARIVESVARAVQFAHSREVIHRDIKPGNILMDEEERPVVTDFGLAAVSRERAEAEERTGAHPFGQIVGTPSYMAPEQTTGSASVTTVTDVYALGTVLYALLTGRAPFIGESRDEILDRVRSRPPDPPRALNSRVPRGLERICLKCLEKDPDRRYATAEALAEDLARWRRRHDQAPVVLAGTALIVLVLAIVCGAWFASYRKAQLLEKTRTDRGFGAEDLAGKAILQLRDLAGLVEELAGNPDVKRSLTESDTPGLEAILGRIPDDRLALFTTCFILDHNGKMLARKRSDSSEEEGSVGEHFHWRDYFKGAKAHKVTSGRSSIHVSRVYPGRSDGLYKFAFSSAIGDAEGKFLGVVATSVTTNASLDLLEDVVVVAPLDAESEKEADAGDPAEYVVLFHPTYEEGTPPAKVPAEDLPFKIPVAHHDQELEPTTSGRGLHSTYVGPDLVDGPYKGKWIAGFAPVGNTGFGVIDQVRYEKAMEDYRELTRGLLILGFVIVAAMGLGLGTWAFIRRGRRRILPRL